MCTHRLTIVTSTIELNEEEQENLRCYLDSRELNINNIQINETRKINSVLMSFARKGSEVLILPNNDDLFNAGVCHGSLNYGEYATPDKKIIIPINEHPYFKQVGTFSE